MILWVVLCGVICGIIGGLFVCLLVKGVVGVLFVKICGWVCCYFIYMVLILGLVLVGFGSYING